ncbi:MAG: DUF2946 domain-containing protein [Proteobacteria bacterium]|nr:DUF2946 domain-containing protein [Pseudomonadota bacterium]
MRSTRFQRWMTRFALVAVLLLATAPTLSRWLQQADGGGEQMAMLMANGAGEMMSMRHHAMPAPEKVPMPMGGTHAGDVCAYCPLLASLLPTLLVLAILLPLLQRIRLRDASVIASRVLPLRLGLGARGPPILL